MREHRVRAVDATALLSEHLEWLISQRYELENLRVRVREAERKTTATYPKRRLGFQTADDLYRSSERPCKSVAPI